MDELVYEERLELAASELKVALLFANLSLAAYSTGRLQQATDARSKLSAPAIEPQPGWLLRKSLHRMRTVLD